MSVSRNDQGTVYSGQDAVDASGRFITEADAAQFVLPNPSLMKSETWCPKCDGRSVGERIDEKWVSTPCECGYLGGGLPLDRERALRRHEDAVEQAAEYMDAARRIYDKPLKKDES